MIQDIYPQKLFNEYHPDSKPEQFSTVLCFDGTKVLIKNIKSEAGQQDQPIGFPDINTLKIQDLNSRNVVYAFSLDDREYYLSLTEDISVPEGYSYMEIRDVRRYSSNADALIVFTGYHLHKWYMDNRFCGCCGAETEADAAERALSCPKCHNKIYPRINPAVIVGVRNGDSLLVTQYREGYNYYALVAGFSEIGETFEETVAREVMEETGLRVKNIRYYKSQPWGIAQDMLAGFFCDAVDTDIKMDPGELKIARWASREEIELQPDSLSLTNEMMMMFKNGKA